MWFLKNVAGQGCYLLAVDTVTKLGKTGLTDIVANVSKDGGATVAATNNATIAEVGGGLYWLPFTQAETNCNVIGVIASSVTSNVVVYPRVGSSTYGVIPVAAVGGSGGMPTYDQVAAIPTGLATGLEVAANTTHLTEIKGAAFVEATHALDQQTTLAAVADAVHDEAISGHVVAGSAGAALADRYWVKWRFNGGTTEDRYEGIHWLKNDTPITSGITLAKIAVINARTGATVISASLLTEVGVLHIWYYDATGVAMTEADRTYQATFTATIDGVTRTFTDIFEGGA